MIVIRDYQPQDSKALAKIFENAILAIDNRIYSTSQKQAWIGNHSDEFWQHRFEKTLPFMAAKGKRASAKLAVLAFMRYAAVKSSVIIP